MNTSTLSQPGLKSDALRGETVIVTGAGGGIGKETLQN
jgi:FlaA1/EpsC-like NDP-sugar epimerase